MHRLGLTTEYCEILNVRVPCVTIPVGPGRHIAVILELAAMTTARRAWATTRREARRRARPRLAIDLGIGF